MKHTTESHMTPCGCRSPGECTHNTFAELEALDALVDAFASEMKKKLRRKALRQGYSGWDDPNWDSSYIGSALSKHVEKGDPIDVANFAAFLWNRSDDDKEGGTQ